MKNEINRYIARFGNNFKVNENVVLFKKAIRMLRLRTEYVSSDLAKLSVERLSVVRVGSTIYQIILF